MFKMDPQEASSEYIMIINLRNKNSYFRILDFVNHPCKLHGFFENKFAAEQQYIICLVETEDNQFDFARLYFWSGDVLKKDINFYQYTEVVPRDIKMDPIVKFRQIIQPSEFQFGV